MSPWHRWSLLSFSINTRALCMLHRAMGACFPVLLSLLCGDTTELSLKHFRSECGVREKRVKRKNDERNEMTCVLQSLLRLHLSCTVTCHVGTCMELSTSPLRVQPSIIPEMSSSSPTHKVWKCTQKNSCLRIAFVAILNFFRLFLYLSLSL